MCGVWARLLPEFGLPHRPGISGDGDCLRIAMRREQVVFTSLDDSAYCPCSGGLDVEKPQVQEYPKAAAAKFATHGDRIPPEMSDADLESS